MNELNEICLIDGSKKKYPSQSTYNDIANDISPQLCKKCIAVRVNGEIKDLSSKIENGANVEFITTDKETQEVLDLIRHGAAHILAYAVQELYPTTQVVLGPIIENGFYYDFERKEPFSLSELSAIEDKMRDIVLRKEDVCRSVISKDDAINLFGKKGEKYKQKIIKELDVETVSLYSEGSFFDLCRGPHIPNTKFIKHFKLLKVSGSYWKGDSKNEPLQRIYGTAWLTKDSLEQYLRRLEEMEKRDHRKIGRELELFHQQPEAPGDIFWHPNGYRIFLKIEQYIRDLIADEYNEVKTPIVMKRHIWETSGHWDKFRENMFALSIENDECAMKPMNCPGHIQIFNNSLRSYRDLPLRLSEFGCCNRFEPSGALHGIMRIRSFTQDDGHIFCTEEQIKEETQIFVSMLMKTYKDFGFNEVKIKFSDRPVNRAGSDATWDKAESALTAALEEMNYKYSLNKGEGAFYGPKLEFVLVDAIGRDWQCGTIQVDMVLPDRLNAYYIDTNGEKQHPVMLHRAILGSIERFVGIIIEHYTGKLPLWLAPCQIVVCSLTDEYTQDVQEFAKRLHSTGILAETDCDSQTINYKIRKHSLKKIPYIAVMGKKEVSDKTINVRELDCQGSKTMDQNEFICMLKQKIENKE